MATAVLPRARSYAVLWREDEGLIRAGKLELGLRSLSLEEGKARSRFSLRSLRYEDLVRVQTAHDPRERIRDQPTIMLKRRGGGEIALAAIDPNASVHDIVQSLADSLSAIKRSSEAAA
jgi:hypothetical protein